ncbi:39426_t:CDS:2, partial [Gigaspora margarita]
IGNGTNISEFDNTINIPEYMKINSNLDSLTKLIYKLSSDDIVSEVTNNNNSILYSSEYLNSLKPTGLPPSFFKLKIGYYAGNLTFIPYISLTSSTSELLFIIRWCQFPIQLAFAMTINKSQRQSVKHVGLDLRTPVFSHGQLYVALSHCTSLCNIKILLLPNSNYTLNIVYLEVILDD